MRREIAALVFAMVFPTVAAAVYFILLGGQGDAHAGARAVQLAYGVSKIVQFAFPVCYLLLVEPSALRTFRFNRRGLWIGVAFGLAIGAGIVVLAHLVVSTWLPDLPGQIRRKMVEFGADRPATFFALAAFLSTIHSFLEEYYWRWFVFGRLRRLLPFAPAAVLSAIGFMGHHVLVLHQFLPRHVWDAVLPFSLAIAVGGVVWAWLYERTGSIAAPWLSHLLVDAAIMYVGYRQVFA